MKRMIKGIILAQKIVLKGLLSLIAFVLLAFVLFHIVEDIRGKCVLNQHKRDCAARGENIGDWQSLIPPPISDDDNIAMAPIFQAMREEPPRRVFGLYLPYTPLNTNYMPNVSGSVWQTGEYENLDKWRVAFSNDNLLAALSIYDDDLREIEEALKRPLYHSKEWDSMRMNSISGPPASIAGYPVRLLAEIYSLRARAKLEAEQYNASLEDIKLGFHLASIEADPTCVSALQRIGTLSAMFPPLWIGINKRVWDAHQLRTLQEMLEPINLADHAARAIQFECRYALSFRQMPHARRADGIWFEDTDIRGETCFFLGDITPFFLSRVSILQEPTLPPLAKFIFRIIPKGWFYQNAVRYSKTCGQLRPAIHADNRWFDIPQTKRAEAPIKPIAEAENFHVSFIYHIVTCAFSGSAFKMIEKCAQMQAAVHQAVIACAIERYRLEHGSIPQLLDELVPAFLERIPNDPIDGQHIRYKLSGDDGYVLYSIGWNGVDDGGKLASKKEYKGARHMIIDINNGDWIWHSYPVDEEKGQLVLPENDK